MENYGDPIPRNKKITKVANKQHNIKSAKAAAAEKGCTYGIDCLNLAENVHESENYSIHEADDVSVHNSKLILVKCRIVQMSNKINKDKIIIHECNILTNVLNPKNAQNQSMIITRQYYRAV